MLPIFDFTKNQKNTKMKTILMSLLILFAVTTSNAQININVKKKINREANQRANSKTDQAIDKSFDKLEEGIGGLFKKKDKNDKENQSLEEEVQQKKSAT